MTSRTKGKDFMDVTLRVRVLMPPKRQQKNITGKPWLFVDQLLPGNKRHCTACNFEVLREISA